MINLGDTLLRSMEEVEETPHMIEFPFAAFKGPIAELAKAVSDAKPVPAELPFVVALSLVGALTGKKLVTSNSLSGHITPANLFIIASAPTGAGKSIAAKELMAPLYALEKETVAEWEDKASELRAKLGVITSRFSSKRGPKPKQLESEPPTLSAEEARERAAIERILDRGAPKWIESDPTPEGLRESMASFGECGYVFSTEAESFVQIMNGKRARGAARFGELCGLFSGDTAGGSRISRTSATLVEPRLSAFLALQPDLAKEIRFGEEARRRGLAGRFIWVSCSEEKPIDPTRPAPIISEDVKAAHRDACRALFSRYATPSSTTPKATVALSLQAAQHIYNRAAEDQKKRREEIFAEVRVRCAELITRTALCLHLMEHGVHAEAREIALETVLGAERFYDWSLSAWISEETGQQDDETQEFWEKIQKLHEDKGGLFTARDIYRKLNISAREADPHIKALLQEQYLEETSVGASKTRYYTIPGR